MKRTLVVVAAVVGFAAAASAGTLTAFTTTSGNVVSNTFSVGDTILLKITGNSEGGLDDAVQGGATWNPAVASQAGATTQGNFLDTQGFLPSGAGFSYFLSQTAASPRTAITAIDTSIITLVATAAGISDVTFAVGTVLDFFGLYQTPPSGAVQHSFTVNPVIPEPATAGLIALGLFGLVFGGRRRA